MNRTLKPSTIQTGALLALAALALAALVVACGDADEAATVAGASRASGGITHFDNLSTTDLTVTDDATITDDVTVTGDLAAATGAFGGGYGSTGCTLSAAGVLQCNGAATIDTTLTAADLVASDDLFITDDATITGTATLGDASIGGGYGSTGCTISSAGVLQCNGAATIPSITLSGDITLGAGSQIYHDTATGEGMLFAAYIDTTYSVTTTSYITIPANADVIDWKFYIVTGYNDSGTDLMVCGTKADSDRYIDDLDVSSGGLNVALDDADTQNDEETWGDVGASAVAITCIYTGQNGNASAGAGRFIIWYRLD